ncbi:MAG TPA: hypothetical protein VK116_20575 [Planctomycetota bacterium]|nr:hypothetical protein [Planctomycetota bacterium]
MRQAIGRTFQFLGLVLVPMALLYYFQHQGQTSETELMYGELMILAIGAGIFWTGHCLARS